MPCRRANSAKGLKEPGTTNRRKAPPSIQPHETSDSQAGTAPDQPTRTRRKLGKGASGRVSIVDCGATVPLFLRSEAVRGLGMGHGVKEKRWPAARSPTGARSSLPPSTFPT